MSLLDFGLAITSPDANKFTSFLHGIHEKRSLLEYPLIAWTSDMILPGRDPSGVPRAFRDVLESNLCTNPFVKHLKTMFEMPSATNVPLVRSSFVESVIKRARDRGPLVDTETDLMPYALGALIAHSPYLPVLGCQSFQAGHLHFRPYAAWPRAHSQATCLLEATSNIMPVAPVEMPADCNLPGFRQCRSILRFHPEPSLKFMLLFQQCCMLSRGSGVPAPRNGGVQGGVSFPCLHEGETHTTQPIKAS